MDSEAALSLALFILYFYFLVEPLDLTLRLFVNQERLSLFEIGLEARVRLLPSSFVAEHFYDHVQVEQHHSVLSKV